jgi:hypothetical protein
MTLLPAAFGELGSYPRPSKCFIKLSCDKYNTLEEFTVWIARSITSHAF